MTFNLKKSQVDIQREFNDAIAYLTSMALEIPEGMPPEEIIDWAVQLQTSASEGEDAMFNLQEVGKAQEEAAEQAQQSRNEMGIPQESMGQIAMKIKPFNLKTAQEMAPPMDPMGLNDQPELMGDQLEQQDEMNTGESLKFRDGAELKTWLESNDFLTARSSLLNYVEDPQTQESIEDSLNRFYEENLDSNGKLKIASIVFDTLPDTLKQPDINEEGLVMAPYVRALVEETNKDIEKLAKEHVKISKSKSFNLKKTAQHKAMDSNVLMYGPKSTRIDPFYMQPVSDYHTIERNKAYNFNIGDIYDIDWETIWRGNIMDKYSRPYRDKDGKWVGGYINKRFEVDNFVPAANDMQLKPGQKRKPFLPQYNSTEARLEDMRSKKDRGYEPVSDGEPFNWKEASSKKKS